MRYRRNDSMLVQHNIPAMLLMRANTHMDIILDEYALIKYICKYATKAETNAEFYDELIEKIRGKRSNMPAIRYLSE